MKQSDIFPSKYIKSDDLRDREVPVVIRDAQIETLGNEKKLVLYFQGKEKGMICNKTNFGRIAYLYGDETDDWAGKEIVLSSEFVEFQGKTVKGLRIKPPTKRPAPPPPPPPAAQQRQHAVTQRDGYRLMTTESVDAIEEATGVRTPNRLVDEDPIPF